VGIFQNWGIAFGKTSFAHVGGCVLAHVLGACRRLNFVMSRVAVYEAAARGGNPSGCTSGCTRRLHKVAALEGGDAPPPPLSQLKGGLKMYGFASSRTREGTIGHACCPHALGMNNSMLSYKLVQELWPPPWPEQQLFSTRNVSGLSPGLDSRSRHRRC